MYDGQSLKHASTKLKGDPEVILKALRHWIPAYKFASTDLLTNREFVIKAFKVMQGPSLDRMQHHKNFFESLQLKFRMDMQVIQVAGVQTSAAQEAAKKMEQMYIAWESSRSLQDSSNKRTRSRSRHAA